MSDEPDREGLRDRLVETIRWLAAEPAKALAVMPDERMTPDEIALDIEHWVSAARDWHLADDDVIDLLGEIDRTFKEMSGQENAARWTPEALRSSGEWASQRERAREVLRLMGVARADDSLV